MDWNGLMWFNLSIVNLHAQKLNWFINSIVVYSLLMNLETSLAHIVYDITLIFKPPIVFLESLSR